MNGAELIVKGLKAEEVDTIFGYPGGAVIPIFDVLYEDPELQVILTRHEQGAIHAADGYARSTGKVGVAIVTSGPGATNATTGLATANFDSVPLVVISGQVPRNMIGYDAFQEADTAGITRSITKHNYLVTERTDLGRVVKEAFHIAGTGKPGPIMIDVPKDIFTAEDGDDYPESVHIRGYHPSKHGQAEQIQEAAELISQAKRPLFYIGGGMHISGAADVFNRIVDKTGIPTVSSLMGLGILDHARTDFLGMIGMHGTFAANMAVTESDLLCAIGVRFDDRATGDTSKFAPNAQVVHIDIDPSTMDRNIHAHVPIVGDARSVLEKLEPLLTKASLGPWLQQVTGWKKERPLVPPQSNSYLSPGDIIAELNEVFPDAIISTEVGQNQMWASHYYHFKQPRTWLTSGGLGTMGYGFPAAIGAQIGNPDKRVIDIAGDGSIQMNIQELATAVLSKAPVIVVILNNGYLGMVRQWQQMFQDSRYSSTCLKKKGECPEDCTEPGDGCPEYTPDFVRLAESFGAVGIRISKPEQIRPALEQAKGITDKPTFIECIVEPEANVYPMVPPGAGINEMVFED
ncbi:MAG: biosynthetic-type acetolactate synthase large subunit [Spirochaetales bacterium]|nr:biosynthetic-type acetolactate synthase large subunit [Spirochaetales bacterium]MCF7939233.1 biosynthetic-type acetolactate synthase large subunit [Spirochaetales bacterium]